MLIYIIRKSIWEYRMFSYGFLIRKLNNQVIDLQIKRERSMKKYERFRKDNKKMHSTLGRYIHY